MVDIKDLNDFYGEFWRSSPNPRLLNADEQLRLNAIFCFIEKHVLVDKRRRLKILDLGCGRGWLTFRLSQFGEVIGLEPLQAAVEYARKLFPGIDVRCSDAAQILREDGGEKFDMVIASEVIEHVEDRSKRGFLENVYRLLAPKGFTILTTPRGELLDHWKRIYPDCDQPIEQWITEKHLRRLAGLVGFCLLRSDRIWAPYFCYNWKGRIAVSGKINIIQKYIPLLPWLIQRFKYDSGLYQILLLQK